MKSLKAATGSPDLRSGAELFHQVYPMPGRSGK